MNFLKITSCLLIFCMSLPAYAGYVIIDGKKIVVQDRGEQSYKLIRIRSLEFSTIEKICKPWLSENGILTYEKKRGSIVVYDYDDIIEKIQNFIKDIDRDVVNIRVEVEFDSVRSSGRVGWKRSKKPQGTITIKGGTHNLPSGFDLEFPIEHNNSSSRYSKQMLMTQSGSPASLWVGENTVHPQWLNELIGSKTITYADGKTVTIREGVDNEMLFVDVGASLMIRPRYLDGGLIEVEVYPEVSYKNSKGGQESIEVESIKTRLVVRPGSRINIGGIINSKLSMYKQLFGKQLYKKDDGRNVLDMYLRATVVKP